jgi:hypothetical protein
MCMRQTLAGVSADLSQRKFSDRGLCGGMCNLAITSIQKHQ